MPAPHRAPTPSLEDPGHLVALCYISVAAIAAGTSGSLLDARLLSQNYANTSKKKLQSLHIWSIERDERHHDLYQRWKMWHRLGASSSPASIT